MAPAPFSASIYPRRCGESEAQTHASGITYRRADLETLELSGLAFDLAYSALTFHYVNDFARLIHTIHRSLAPGGELVFTIEHPIFMAAAQPRWVEDHLGQKAWPVSQYAIEGERRTDWFASGVIKYHRTIATTLNTLIDTGFPVRAVKEWARSPEQIERSPLLGIRARAADDALGCCAPPKLTVGTGHLALFRSVSKLRKGHPTLKTGKHNGSFGGTSGL